MAATRNTDLINLGEAQAQIGIARIIHGMKPGDQHSAAWAAMLIWKLAHSEERKAPKPRKGNVVQLRPSRPA